MNTRKKDNSYIFASPVLYAVGVFTSLMLFYVYGGFNISNSLGIGSAAATSIYYALHAGLLATRVASVAASFGIGVALAGVVGLMARKLNRRQFVAW
ncbi:MAG: hypothetical protein J6M18_06555 [Actinomycetaceae bacterium]|nr:hypothetical protein [Actinomycetaceae bacterium]